MTEISDLRGNRTLVLHGELDIATAPELVEMLTRLRHFGHAVTLDLAEVTFMDSTGLTTLMDAQVQSQRNGWEFTVRRPSPAVKRVFELAGVGRLLGRVVSKAVESHTVPQQPTVSIDALETFVELLSRVEADPSADDFYSRLCEATCRLADMDRAVIFRYDGARRRVRAAGAYGIDLEIFADAQVTVETVQVAREALVEDRVIEVSSAMADGVPEEYRALINESTLVCTPMAAAGRWLGVILSDRKPDRPPLSDSERHLLWTLGKTAALAAFARLATNKQAQARQLSERMDLAREVHESVIQRLFGIQLVFSSQAELSPAARERIGAELQAALFDLRRALQRPLGRQAPETNTTLLQEVERLRREHRDLHLTLRPGSERVVVPHELEALAQSVLAEAVRNAHKHSGPTKVEVSLEVKDEDTLVLDIINDGVRGRARQSGMGLKLAALEALQFGGIVEFGERDPGHWRVRLAVPLDRA